jgi:hypothetical protein
MRYPLGAQHACRLHIDDVHAARDVHDHEVGIADPRLPTVISDQADGCAAIR